jgi:hypothetical protein
MHQVTPIINVVKETKSRIAGMVPHVANELDEVNMMLGDLSLQAGEVAPSNLQVEPLDEEAKKVLEESGALAEQQISEKFPELPSVEGRLKARINEPIALTNISEGMSIDSLLYEYIKSHGGYLDFSKAALDLGTSCKDVKEAFQRLRDEGKVVVD